ncbi:hypothetical protein [Sharpea azabuensis]|uniref:hypothetical protein n=1 Tax=Sharpea azabuensis TaxID=322505 RepID=UPI0013D98149|nr:hypothetical protein [Sharpea azabuensis]
MNHIHYGDELWFIYNNTKYFLEGFQEDGICRLYLFEMFEGGKDFVWDGDHDHFPVNAFLNAPIFDGKTFYEVEKDIIWVDC